MSLDAHGSPYHALPPVAAGSSVPAELVEEVDGVEVPADGVERETELDGAGDGEGLGALEIEPPADVEPVKSSKKAK
jgi:hypothetical protein